ncbi:MAG: hypothetical protein ACFFCW_07565 [Candidatus Hodarchaeota archaeon]
MSQLPPAVLDSDFQAVDTVNEDEIRRRFGAFIRDLHSFLNQLHSLSDIQQVRLRWKGRVQYEQAFGTFATDPKHWYTFNHGGTNEAQFNIGLFTTHLRVGLGFEFTLKKGGDPTVVGLAYACFTNVIKRALEGFKQFVHDTSLEVEWFPANGDDLEFVPTEKVIQWLLQPPRDSRGIRVSP